jgi:hypothetical protein
MDLRSKSDAQIAEAVFISELEKKSGERLQKPKANLTSVHRYNDPKIVSFHSNDLRAIFDKVKLESFSVHPKTGNMQLPKSLAGTKIKIGSTIYKLGIGGLHSTEKKQFVKPDKNQRLIDADVTSFDGGYGSAYLAKMVGQKKAREIFFLGRNYSAQEAYEMGMVNAVIPHDELEDTAYDWAQEILAKSPTSIKMLKFAMNLTDDGMVGQQVFAGEATRLAYMTEEATEGRNAFLEKRKPNFEKKWLP